MQKAAKSRRPARTTQIWRQFWAAVFAAAFAAAAVRAEEINLYTDRQEVFLRAVIAEYESESGDEVNTLFVKKGLLQRVQAEGDSSPADVFLAAGIGPLLDFVEDGRAAPLADPEINAAIPANLRGKNGQWFAVTRRVRALYAAPGAESKVQTYADLAKPENTSVCLRSGAHPYNNALFADIIARRGREAAKKWMLAVKKNMARKPQGKDRAQINAVANGECAFAVANSYYYFHLINNAEAARKKILREKTALIIPQDAHINITGMALARRAPHPEAAVRLMRFLAGKTAQQMLAAQNFEFPARNDIPYPPALRPYRNAVENAEPLLAQTAKLRGIAAALYDETGFDR
ncbi:MAG: extracellular solute-binding protein [Gammaproteobacteria bacterium]